MNGNKGIDIDKVAQALSLDQKPQSIFFKECRNSSCDFCGAMDKIPRGSLGVLILLFLCGFLPGLIYWIAHRGYVYNCPKCGAKY